MTRALVLLALLCGCVTAPDLPPAATRAEDAAAYPTLVPIGPIIAAAGGPTAIAPGAALEARAAALNARAAAMRGPVIDAATAAALQAGPQSPSLQ